MGAIEQIKKMKQQGKTDQEITQTLQNQGVSPKAINEAFGQAQIKDAVSGSQEYNEPPMPNENLPQTPVQENQDYYDPQPQTQDYSQQNYSPPEQDQYYDQSYDQGQGGYEQEQYYPQQGGYNSYSSAGTSTDTMIEIAGQVFEEKTKKIQKQISEINEFKTITGTKIENYGERIKKIESIIDKLQIAILEKIGSYGQNLNSIKKEMSMMQDSFSKTLPEFAKKYNSKNKTSHKKKK